MNGQLAESSELVRQLVVLLADINNADVVICPPFTALTAVRLALAKSQLLLGAQNAHFALQGAYTGEISMPMLKDLCCSYVLVGHSERRQYFCEDDELAARKVASALEQGLIPVLCVGESVAIREEGRGEAHVLGQVQRGLSLLPAGQENFVIAYEPIWAIGTGRAASPADANRMLAAIREWLLRVKGVGQSKVRLLYGGSVTAENMADFAREEHIDGVLVGGASLRPGTFAEIVRQSSGKHFCTGQVHV